MRINSFETGTPFGVDFNGKTESYRSIDCNFLKHGRSKTVT